jgi:prepilin-type processing-associated H-X9-DG protein
VVVVVIAILAGLLLPALAAAKQKGIRVQCLSNLKQVGVALQMYTDENEESLPGPVWSAAMASYDRNSSQELIWYIAENLGAPAPATVRGGRPVVADVFVCPGFRREAPNLTGLIGRKIYLLNDDIDPNPANRVRPFGYPPDPITGAPEITPLKITAFDNYVPPGSLYAVTDLDTSFPGLNTSISWYNDLPTRPVHGQVRNQLFFDWHAEAARW